MFSFSHLYHKAHQYYKKVQWCIYIRLCVSSHMLQYNDYSRTSVSDKTTNWPLTWTKNYFYRIQVGTIFCLPSPLKLAPSNATLTEEWK